MTPEETAQGVANLVGRCHVRIIGIGAAQYSTGDTQKWETKSPAQLCEETLEEVEDAIAYLSFLHMRVSALRGSLLDPNERTYPAHG